MVNPTAFMFVFLFETSLSAAESAKEHGKKGAGSPSFRTIVQFRYTASRQPVDGKYQKWFLSVVLGSWQRDDSLLTQRHGENLDVWKVSVGGPGLVSLEPKLMWR
jgi:hypothetical protein